MCVYFVPMLCVSRFGLGWAHDAFKFACHMFMHFHAYVPSCFYHLILKLLCMFLIVSLSLSLSLSPSLSISYVSCIMAPKRKSTPSYNPLHSGASSSSSPSDPTPSHVQFCDEKAKPDFLENFSWRGIHSERHSFCQTFLTLTYPLPSIVGVGSHFVAS